MLNKLEQNTEGLQAILETVESLQVGGSGLNIAYGTTPPADTSKLWVPLAKRPDNVEISGDSLQNAVDTIQTMVTKMETVVRGASAVSIDGKIYIFGGSDGDDLDTIREYDPATDRIVTKSAVLESACPYSAVVAINGKAYIFGGKVKTSSNAYYYGSTTIQEYDPVADTITTKNAVLPKRSYKHSAVAINGKAYIFGGMSHTQYSGTTYTYLDTILEYDPSTDTIVTKDTVLPTALNHMAAVVINNKVYLFGGSSGTSISSVTNTIQEYDPVTDTIVTKNAVLPNETSAANAVEINGKAYIFGGYVYTGSNAGGELDTIKEYDPVTDTIVTKNAALAAGLGDMSVSKLDGKAYIFGGADNDNTPTDIIQEYTPKAYLGANHLKVFASVYKSEVHQVVTNIVNGKKDQLKLYMTSAFLGDDDGYAMAQDAYVYDTVNGEWQALDGTSMTTDMLNALAELGVS